MIAELGEMVQPTEFLPSNHEAASSDSQPPHIKLVLGAGEMAQPLRELAALLKVLSSIPSNHGVAHDHIYILYIDI